MGITTERNNQIVIGLLKYHGIKKIIASPGATNVSFVASVQSDPFFEIYSSVDERSAAYIACGMAAESGEPVVLTCTGATASRNYLPGLTEAYYRHLPVLAITSTMPISRIGHNIPQSIDRSNVINDVAKLSVHIPMVKDEEDEWICNTRANEAILELKHNVCGPVHINLETTQGGTFKTKEIIDIRPIDRIVIGDKMPNIDAKCSIFVGAHLKWDKELTEAVDTFCERYNAVVIGDHTSNYKGKYGCLASVISSQRVYHSDNLKSDFLIHIGDISGAYINLNPKEVWRISPDGKVCDTFRQLRYVFKMNELSFFESMNELKEESSDLSYYNACKEEYNKLLGKIPELPFSNVWLAQQLAEKLPASSVLHLGILNSLRSWNFFQIDNTIDVYSNTGGFGIDGCISSLLGASMVEKDKLFYGVFGDLAFFYDMNALGNRHWGSNVRILIVNNGGGQEFRNFGHRAAQFGEDTDTYIAAAGHYGNKSSKLVKEYATELGFEYMSATDKETAASCINKFTNSEQLDKPIIFEVFTETEDETEAIRIMGDLEVSVSVSEGAKSLVKGVLGEKRVKTIKKLLKG